MERKKQANPVADVQEGARNVKEGTQRTTKRDKVYTPWKYVHLLILVTYTYMYVTPFFISVSPIG